MGGDGKKTEDDRYSSNGDCLVGVCDKVAVLQQQELYTFLKKK